MLGLRAIGQGSGGVEKAVEEISTRLAGRGHDVTVFCRARYNRRGLDHFQGVRLVNLPAIYTKHLEAATHSFLAALRALRGFDIVHFHAIGPSMFSWLPRLTGQRVVATVHALDWRREKWSGFAKFALRLGARAATTFPQRTIVVSRTIQQLLKDRFGRDTTYIPNGVTPGVRRPINNLARFGLKGNDYILYLGRLVPEKGCHLLIRAFREMNTDRKLLIAGDESHSDRYAAELHELARGDSRIVFAGALYGEDKDEAFSNASLFVLPSTLEGMPIVLLEAMSYGTPVLCSDIPENMEVVRPAPDDALYADLFRSGSSDDLLARMNAAIQPGTVLAERADNAQAYVRRSFSWDAITDEIEALYASLPQRSRWSIPERISARNRGRKWSFFLRVAEPDAQTRILDVGFAEKEFGVSDNYIEKHHAWPANITALGVTEPVTFSNRYPDVKAVCYDGRIFPFDQYAFDVCWSNAVIEHVGNRDRQIRFIREANRVARLAFITTPNRAFPIEIHTRIPLLHLLPKAWFDRFLRFIGKGWAAGDYMHLLSLRDLRALLADAGIRDYVIVPNRLFGFLIIDFVVLFGDHLEQALARMGRTRAYRP